MRGSNASRPDKSKDERRALLLRKHRLCCCLLISLSSFLCCWMWSSSGFYSSGGTWEPLHHHHHHRRLVPPSPPQHVAYREAEFEARREKVRKIKGNEADETRRMFWHRLRYVRRKDLLYCENYKVASNTWAANVIRLVTREEPPRPEKLHLDAVNLASLELAEDVVSRHWTSYIGARNSLVLVRNPFHRLVSAYQDKVRSGLEAARILGQSPPSSSSSTFPSFEQFVRFVVNSSSGGWRAFNNHWRPFYMNCGMCHFPYRYIIKLETYVEDVSFLKWSAGLREVAVSARLRKAKGPKTEDEAKRMFSRLGKELKTRLYQVYRMDFEMFGYDASEYIGR